MLEQVRTSASTSNTMSMEADILDSVNAEQGNLGDGDCDICHNKGYILFDRDGYRMSRECQCMARRRSAKRIRESGLSELMKRYTLDSYETPEGWQKSALGKARRFVSSDTGWFTIVGDPGTGKTHLCTAICGVMMESGKETRYLLWREVIPKLKACVNDREQYDRVMDDLKRCEVLYIDDFLKGTITDADINIAFELLNSRYNDTRKRTIISGEKRIEDIMNIDEAIGSRIYERSKGCIVNTGKTNWRLKNV